MVLTPKQHKFLYANSSAKRHGLSNQFNHWPNGLLPYAFANDFDERSREMVLNAMDYIRGVSCITFEENASGDHVKFVNSDGCSSHVGDLKRGAQPISLSFRCGLGSTIHEILHALGFLHMHTAAERDDYVTINWGNVMRGTKHNFDKYTTHVSMFGTEYDYRSIMHYGAYFFAVDKSIPTITPLNAPESAMGQRNGE